MAAQFRQTAQASAARSRDMLYMRFRVVLGQAYCARERHNQVPARKRIELGFSQLPLLRCTIWSEWCACCRSFPAEDWLAGGGGFVEALDARFVRSGLDELGIFF